MPSRRSPLIVWSGLVPMATYSSRGKLAEPLQPARAVKPSSIRPFPRANAGRRVILAMALFWPWPLLARASMLGMAWRLPGIRAWRLGALRL